MTASLFAFSSPSLPLSRPHHRWNFVLSFETQPLSQLISISKLTSVGAMQALNECNKAGKQEALARREAQAQGGRRGRRGD